jgi:phosphotransferase system HPr-like phosphotransfer protein
MMDDSLLSDFSSIVPIRNRGQIVSAESHQINQINQINSGNNDEVIIKTNDAQNNINQLERLLSNQSYRKLNILVSNDDSF